MTGFELQDVCKKQEDKGCVSCPAQRQCKTWKETLRKTHTLEPWELDTLLKIVTDITEGDL